MRKHYVKHDNLRRYLEEFHIKGEDVSDETLKNIFGELKHSNLIVAGDLNEFSPQLAIFEHEDKRYGFLFTDMDEFRKFVPDGECGSQTCEFAVYKMIVESGDVDGFVLNPESEGFVIIRKIFESIEYLPEHEYPQDGAYSTGELKALKDSIDNKGLEKFIGNSSNIGRYEELFEEISNSTLLTLMVSREDLAFMAEDGVISLVESEPKGFLYLDEIGGKYATVYTSEDKINEVSTEYNKYSQLVNFSQLTNYILNDDLDGIIINPNCENVLLTREVLLEYSHLLEDTCNDSRLNTAIMHMFLIEEAA
jgi:hypothetical protein